MSPGCHRRLYLRDYAQTAWRLQKLAVPNQRRTRKDWYCWPFWWKKASTDVIHDDKEGLELP